MGELNMKPFNLDEYLKNPNKKVVTRDGRNVKIHCTNYNSNFPIIAQIEGAHSSDSFTKDGKFSFWKDTQDDLFFVTEKHEGWVHVFRDSTGNSYMGLQIFESKEAAEKDGEEYNLYVTTVKIEWEE